MVSGNTTTRHPLRKIATLQHPSSDLAVASLSSATNLTQTWNQQQPTPNNHTGSAAIAFPDDYGRTITWNLTNCYNSAASAVAIKRLSAN